MILGRSPSFCCLVTRPSILHSLPIVIGQPKYFRSFHKSDLRNNTPRSPAQLQQDQEMKNSKKKQASNVKASSNNASTTGVVQLPPFLTRYPQQQGTNLLIKLLVKPGAKQNNITTAADQLMTCDEVGVQIAAPPRDGEANEGVVDYVSSVLALKKRQVSLHSGHKARNKVVLVDFESDVSSSSSSSKGKASETGATSAASSNTSPADKQCMVNVEYVLEKLKASCT